MSANPWCCTTYILLSIQNVRLLNISSHELKPVSKVLSSSRTVDSRYNESRGGTENTLLYREFVISKNLFAW